MNSRHNTLLSWASHRLARVEQFFCSLLITAFGIVLIANVFARYVLNSPLYFANELAVYILIWMAFLAISITIQNDQHIRLTMLTGLLPASAQRICYWLTELVCIAILAVMLWYSIGWLRSPSVAFDIALTLDWPKWHFYLIIPVFCATSIFHLIARLLDRSRTVFALASDEE